jgi:hypothetical protein
VNVGPADYAANFRGIDEVLAAPSDAPQGCLFPADELHGTGNPQLSQRASQAADGFSSNWSCTSGLDQGVGHQTQQWFIRQNQ